MKRLRIAIVLLAIPIAASHAEPAQAGLLAVTGTSQAALLAQNTPFEPRLQLHTALRAGVGTTLGPAFRFAAGFGLERAVSTRLVDGYSYTGWTGRTLWMRLGYEPPDGSLGVEATAHGVLVGFDDSYLLLFFPAVDVGPYYRVALFSRTSLKITLRIGYEFRQDLVLTLGSITLPGTPYAGVAVEAERFIPRQAPPASAQ
jgi:hypothetical protein